VGGGVVEHEVQFAVGVGLDDAAEEGEELLVAGAGVALADDFARGDVEPGVQAGGAVALVVVAVPFGLAVLERRDRLGAVQDGSGRGRQLTCA
jgi:hypothetical protein